MHKRVRGFLDAGSNQRTLSRSRGLGGEGMSVESHVRSGRLVRVSGQHFRFQSSLPAFTGMFTAWLVLGSGASLTA